MISFMVTRIRSKKPVKHFIKEWRELRGLTLEQVAERIESGRGTLSRYENYERDIPIQAAAAIAYALNLEIADLFLDPQRPTIDQLLRGKSIKFIERGLELAEKERAKKDGTSG